MRFILEVDLAHAAGEPAKELGRILRYWGSTLTDELLAPGAAQDIDDSTYTRVGSWEVVR